MITKETSFAGALKSYEVFEKSILYFAMLHLSDQNLWDQMQYHTKIISCTTDFTNKKEIP